MPRRLVISLGGNAFAREGEAMTMARQFRFAADTLAPLTALLTSVVVVVLVGKSRFPGRVRSLNFRYGVDVRIAR